MALILEDFGTPEAVTRSLESLLHNGNWYDDFINRLRVDAERYSALSRIVDEAGHSDFCPITIEIFQNLTGQRYFSNDPVFVCENDILNKWNENTGISDSARSFSLFDQVEVYFPSFVGAPGNRDFLSAFGFLSMNHSLEDGIVEDKEAARLLGQVNKIFFPVLKLSTKLLQTLRDLKELERFINSFSQVVRVANHDFLHGITNPNRHESISEGFDFKSNTYLRDFVNLTSVNRMNLEECIAIDLNRKIFDNLREGNGSEFSMSFFESLGEVIDIAISLPEAERQEVQYLLKGQLSFLFSKDALNETGLEYWADLARNEPTRDDISLAKWKESPLYEPMAVSLNGDTQPQKARKKRKPTLDDLQQADEYHNSLLEENQVPDQREKEVQALIDQDDNMTALSLASLGGFGVNSLLKYESQGVAGLLQVAVEEDLTSLMVTAEERDTIQRVIQSTRQAEKVSPREIDFVDTNSKYAMYDWLEENGYDRQAHRRVFDGISNGSFTVDDFNRLLRQKSGHYGDRHMNPHRKFTESKGGFDL